MRRRFSLPAIGLLVVIIIMSCALVACPSPKPQETVTLRMTIVQPPQDVIAAECVNMADRFNERAGGAYVLEVYPAEQLAKYTETMDAVRTGAIEMANIGWGGFANSLFVLTAAEIPFMYDSVEANAEVARLLPEVLDEQFQTNLNIKPLACHHTGAIEVATNKPIETLEDWQGVKIAGSTYYGPEVAEVLGAAPVFVAYPEFYTSLQKGVVDAVLDVPTFTVIGKIYEVIKYETIFCGIGTSHGIIINLDVWNSMPKNMQDILEEEAKKTGDTINEAMIGQYYANIDELGNLGIEQSFITAAERDRWKAEASSWIEEQEVAMGDIGQEIKQLAGEANQKHPYPY
jgi:TRAP-type C4-dicarboxylate transport system substrate-binding protein